MKPGKRTPGGVKVGPKEGDMIPPVPGGDGKWRRVVLVQRGVVKGVEVWHGDPPQETKTPKRAAKKATAWTPKERNPFDLSPLTEKFILWQAANGLLAPPPEPDLTADEAAEILKTIASINL